MAADYLRDALGRFMSRGNVPANLAPINADLPALPEEAPPVEFGKNYHTAQIYSKGYEFAFMTNQGGTYHQACTFVYCKDFLHDAVWAHVNNKPWQIYGFKYTPGKDLPLDMNNCVFAFRNTLYKSAEKSKEFHANRAACQEFLNGIEKKLGFQPSRIYEVPHSQGPCWLVIGDPRWQIAAPMVGFYTLFIRMGIAHVLGESVDETLKKAHDGKIKIGEDASYAGNRDASYIKSSWKALQVLLEHSTAIFHPTIQENYPPDMPDKVGSLHDNLGPVNFAKNASVKKAMPFWFREQYWK
jgi:hypothetical protein